MKKHNNKKIDIGLAEFVFFGLLLTCSIMIVLACFIRSSRSYFVLDSDSCIETHTVSIFGYSFSESTSLKSYLFYDSCFYIVLKDNSLQSVSLSDVVNFDVLIGD